MAKPTSDPTQSVPLLAVLPLPLPLLPLLLLLLEPHPARTSTPSRTTPNAQLILDRTGRDSLFPTISLSFVIQQ
jgi:hypothetical protein